MSIATDTVLRRHRISVDEYYRMAEVGLLAPDAKVELIDGEVIDLAPVGTKHFYLVNLLTKILGRTIGERAILSVQQPIRLSSDSEPQPDLALLKPPAENYLKALPDGSDVLLLIEVSDTTLRYDLEVKAQLYARNGVPEVWVIDINTKTLHRLRQPNAEQYASIARLQAGRVEIAALPGVSIDIGEFFNF